MARFRGTIKGPGAGASISRLGSKASGLITNANGWDVGVRVEARVVAGKDTFDVHLTGGSNGGQRTVFLGTFDEGDLGRAVRDKPPSERDLNDAAAIARGLNEFLGKKEEK
jgi:hypothetical protein